MSKSVKNNAYKVLRAPSFAMRVSNGRLNYKKIMDPDALKQKEHGNVDVLKYYEARRKAKKSRRAMKDVLDIFTETD